MKIKNPNFNNDDQARLIKYKGQIEAYIKGLPADQEFIDFEKIKSDIMAMNLPGITLEDITDRKLFTICENYGIQILE